MGVIEDVVSIKQALQEVKEETKKESIRIRELKKLKKTNKILLKSLVVMIFAFIFLLSYTIFAFLC